MSIKNICFLISLNFLLSSECLELKSLYESDNISASYALIMNKFMESNKAEYGSSDCNFTAYNIAVKLDDLELAKKYIESAIKNEDLEIYRNEAEKLTKTIRDYKSSKYTLENGTLDDAINEFKNKINSDDLLPVALFHKGLGTAYKKKHFESDLTISDPNYFNNLDFSVDYFVQSININPYKDYDLEILNISKYLTKSGKEFQKDDDYESALLLFNKAIEFSPNYKLSYFYKGQLYMRIQDYELALESFQAGLGDLGSNMKSANYKILYLVATAHERLGDLDKALVFYSNSFKNKSSYTKAQFGKANVLYKMQNFDDSESELLDLIKSTPDYIKAYELIVNLYLDRNDLLNAKKYAELGINFNSKSFALLAQLAFVSNENKNYDEAINYANNSMKYKPNYGPALIELGRAYTFNCKFVAAKDAFKRAKRFDRRMASELEKWSKDHTDSACK